MKTFKTILLITGVLVAGLAFNSVAQTPKEKTSTREYYASNHDKHKAKHKHKEHKEFKSAHKANAKSDKAKFKTHPKHKAKHHKENKD